jgi:galactokinase/mevalonate kinase-like predicted kinase
MTSTTTQQRIEKLIAAAKENGATAKFGIGMTQDGRVVVFAEPVSQRTRPMRDHFRAAFYLEDGNRIQRVSRANFEKAMEADPS